MSSRLAHRLWRHHLPLALLSGGGRPFALCHPPLFRRADPVEFVHRLAGVGSFDADLADRALALTCGKPPAVSLDLRRDTGIWAGILGLLHTGVGQCVHLRGRPWLYYVYDKWTRTSGAAAPRHFRFLQFRRAVCGADIAGGAGDLQRRVTARAWAMDSGKACSAGFTLCFALAAFHTFGYLLGIESLKPRS